MRKGDFDRAKIAQGRDLFDIVKLHSVALANCFLVRVGKSFLR